MEGGGKQTEHTISLNNVDPWVEYTHLGTQLRSQRCCPSHNVGDRRDVVFLKQSLVLRHGDDDWWDQKQETELESLNAV